MQRYHRFFRDYIRIYQDGQDVPEAPGDIPLLGLGRRAFTDRYTFDGGHEPNIYIVFGKYGGLEHHILTGKVAYLPNVLRIRRCGRLSADLIFNVMRGYRDITRAVRDVPDMDMAININTLRAIDGLRHAYYSLEILWNTDIRIRNLTIKPFTNYKIETDYGDNICVVIVEEPNIQLEIYPEAFVAYVRGEKIIISSRCVAFYWGVVLIKDGCLLLEEYGFGNMADGKEIRCAMIAAAQQNPLRILPLPISNAIIEQIPDLELREDSFEYKC